MCVPPMRWTPKPATSRCFRFGAQSWVAPTLCTTAQAGWRAGFTPVLRRWSSTTTCCKAWPLSCSHWSSTPPRWRWKLLPMLDPVVISLAPSTPRIATEVPSSNRPCLTGATTSHGKRPGHPPHWITPNAWSPSILGPISRPISMMRYEKNWMPTLIAALPKAE